MDEVINLERRTILVGRNCSECGESISEARLKARPSAQLCLKCQEREEAQAASSYVPPVAYFHPRQVESIWKHASAYSKGVDPATFNDAVEDNNASVVRGSRQ